MTFFFFFAFQFLGVAQAPWAPPPLDTRLHFQRVFVEFVALLTKIWPKNIDFTITAKCWREAVQRADPPPP